ncbi:amidohydrolase family protein [Sphingobium sp. CAP-1]|uniref:amidohydrolase family protein n=1 Tax=Sphingobium sp. CAP-1 TaxID=2676077 RepID=UPI0012BB4010|nr:amidohydrolase family protein [Sphingobium sp. CAP-1]QGP80401.1 amidohydrolase family protein [Sphingobium sp. CAP-1]
MADRNIDKASGGFSRRHALQGALLAGALGAMPGGLLAATAKGPRRQIIRGATVISRDPKVGNLPVADILIEGETIKAIGANLGVTDAERIDGAGMIAMPGFVDTHRHMWQGAIRRVFPDATLDEYFGQVLAGIGPHYRPEDVHVGNLVSALSAIDAGVTSILDWSHIQNSPAHSDAAIAALQASSIRAVFGYGTPQTGAVSMADDKKHRYPQDIKRLRATYFNSPDQLLTLALAADGPSFGPVEPAIAEWNAAREVGARISVHVMGPQTLDNLKVMHGQGLLKDDTTYVHCTNLPDEAWKLLAATGGTISISSSIEMQMGHGMPAVQAALDHGIRPSLSVDVETSAPNDMFTQMRSLLSLQRLNANEAKTAGDTKAPALLTASEVLDFATIEGARANGLGGRTGSLAPGKQADILLLRTGSINSIPVRRSDPVGAVVLGMDSSNIDSVFIAGRALKRDGKLIGVDLPALTAKAAASQAYLLEKAGFPA